MSKTIYIFDLDGCLVDDSWRLHLCDWKNREFKEYHDNLVYDDRTLLPGMKLLSLAMQDQFNYGPKEVEIHFSTARPFSHNKETNKQIRDLLGAGNAKYTLHMRTPDQEGIKSAELKRQNLNRILLEHPGEMVEVIAFDDHPDVVVMYREEGVQSYLVNKRFVINNKAHGALKAIRSGDSEFKSMVSYNYSDPEANIGFIFASDDDKNVPHPVIIRKLADDLIGSIQERRCAMFTLVDKSPEARDMRVYNSRDPSIATPGTVIGIDKAKPGSERTAICTRTKLDYITNPFDKADKAEEPKAIGPERGTDGCLYPILNGENKEPKQTAADILAAAAETFRERNGVYKDNALVVGKVMEALFPKGVALKTEEDYHIWHLFEILIVKLTRFTNSGMHHEDSIHDLMVYAAMIEPLIQSHNIDFGDDK